MNSAAGQNTGQPASPAPPPDAGLARWRRLVGTACAALLLLAGVRLWLVDGLLRRVSIDGPSMAPGLCGAHYEIT